MVSKNITVNIPSQRDARPAALLVQLACQFDSSVYLEVENKRVNAKSIMGMMSLDIMPGREMTLITRGTDEQQAMSEIEAYLTAS